MEVLFKKIKETARPPERAHDSDAGFDLFCNGFNYPPSVDSLLFVEATTGIALQIPQGYVGLVFPRSSISNTRHMMRNCVGVIDSGYRGEIKLRFSIDDSSTKYKTGDKVGQIVFLRLPKINLVESSHLSSSERSSGGFGSTGS